MDEWDLRASRSGSLAVMSVRYPVECLESVSADYVDKVIQFMDGDLNGKIVLEVGSGIGRMTKYLAEISESVTCVDLCESMHRRNEYNLGELKNKVRLKRCFIQEFHDDAKFDVCVCSLVLIHNVSDSDFGRAVEVMCRCADTIFLFEDVTADRPTSPQTRLVSSAILEESFEKCGFVSERTDKYVLFQDTISFVKFVRSHALEGGKQNLAGQGHA